MQRHRMARGCKPKGETHLVKQDSAVSLEGLPLQAGPEDDQRGHRPIRVETQVLCNGSPRLSALLVKLCCQLVSIPETGRSWLLDTLLHRSHGWAFQVALTGNR